MLWILASAVNPGILVALGIVSPLLGEPWFTGRNMVKVSRVASRTSPVARPTAMGSPNIYTNVI